VGNTPSSTIQASGGPTSVRRSATASHTEPASAKKMQFTLVNGFLPCDTPNTATQSGNMPACTPAVPGSVQGSGCALTSTGSGKLTAGLTGSVAAGNEDVKFAASARGLNSFCENEELCISLSFRATTDDCPEGSCTTEDINDYPIEGGPPICCIVHKGACKIKATLLTAFPGIFARGALTGIEILGCGLQARPPAGPHLAELSCGILFK
jgi:hypothetical protein